jgi:hypothetical protein
MDATWVLRDVMVPLATVGTAAVGSYVALVGLSTWKRQLSGQTDHELARRLLITLYRYRNAINRVRHPAMFANEFTDPPADKREHMNSAQIRFYGTVQAYQNRWSPVAEQRAEIDAELIEAEAIWDAALKSQIFAELFALEWELQTTVRNHLILCDPDEKAERKRVIEKMGVRDEVLYDSLSKEGDAFSNRLSEAVDKVAAYLKPKMAR